MTDAIHRAVASVTLSDATGRFKHCHVRLRLVRLEVTVRGPEGALMGASLPPVPAQLRAMVSLVEGLALWQGTPLQGIVATSVA